MVFTNKYSKILIEKFPDFAKSTTLAEEYEFRGEDTITVHTLISALTNYIANEVVPSNNEITAMEVELYNFIEECRKKFKSSPEESEEGEFDNAICTCFLESLINKASWNNDLYNRFIPYLGPNCIDFCKEWDIFTGVPSPGLWTDKEWKDSQSR